MTAPLQGPAAFVPSQDHIELVDLCTNQVMLKWGGAELDPDELTDELAVDSAELSIRQFTTKWDIPD